jgi:hypothetical protein
VKVLQIDYQENPTTYEGIQTNQQENLTKYEGITNQQINTKYKESIANRLAIKPFKQ